MTTVAWSLGPVDGIPDPGDAPLVWFVRLNDPETERTAHRALLSQADLLDLASRPDAGMRGMRRRLSKVLLSRLSGVHPDEIVIERLESGALRVLSPTGWYLSVAGRWPQCLIGVGRRPIGVDIEPLDAEPPPEDCFTPAEHFELRFASAATRLARWTAKEAHGKCLGIASRIEAAEIETRWVSDGLHVVSVDGSTKCVIRLQDDTVQACAGLLADAGHPPVGS